MTSLVAGTMAASAEFVHSLTRGQDGSWTGFLAGSAGSISPSTLNGESITYVRTDGTELQVAIDGTHSKDFFSRLRCSLGVFSVSDSTRSVAEGVTFWVWGHASKFPTSGSENVVFNL